VAQGSVYQAIAQLRRTLGEAAEQPTYINTVSRKGYLIASAAKSACSKGLALTLVPPGKIVDVHVALASSLEWQDTKRSVGADNRRFGSTLSRYPPILLASAWLLMPAFWSVEPHPRKDSPSPSGG
jgi:hypothetical protein